MKCVLCKKKSIGTHKYCQVHFTEYFESIVKETIKKFDLFKKNDKVAVAVSGGKDSMTVLKILHDLGYNVTAISIDEGIKGYREKTIEHVKDFCRKNNIRLRIYTYENEFGKRLDDMSFKGLPCSTCGVLRRDLLNKYSQDFDVIATGHNMDDEAQGVVMNLLKNNTGILKRLGPISGIVEDDKFTKRVKPLYFCKEKEVIRYTSIKKIKTEYCPCPNKRYAFRLRVKVLLDRVERKTPETKKNILDWFLAYKEGIKSDFNVKTCVVCGGPSANTKCNKCKIINMI